MLFNSFAFIFVFLPMALVATYALGRWRQAAAKAALTLLSLGFYAWWRPIHLPLLLGSIAFNFIVGRIILRAIDRQRPAAVKVALTVGIIGDLALLGYFKYANFIVDNANLLGAHIAFTRVALPLAISFFTFQKIAYLMDTARGETKPMNLLDFALFTAFFPQLIAGPIVHYKEVVPQLQGPRFGRLFWRNLMVGLVIFSIGLFKKTVIADTLAAYANPVFAQAAQGAHVSLTSAWLAAITFTFQLYFDFSGYSDMAIGLGRMLGVKLPLNFHSPLRAANIIEYWRRWHMTLQRFIGAYIFRPLSVPFNRLAATRGLGRWSTFLLAVCVPMFATMLASGIWHGAGWTFILWGLIHAAYLCINEAWREARKLRRRKLIRAGRTVGEPRWPEIVLSHALTLVAVIYANAMFRAVSIQSALSLWASMTGLAPSGAVAPPVSAALLCALAACTFIVFMLPNTQQIMGRFNPAHNWSEWRDTAPAPIRWTWRPSTAGLAYAGALLFLGVMFIQRGQAVFLYFKF